MSESEGGSNLLQPFLFGAPVFAGKDTNLFILQSNTVLQGL